MAAVAERCGRGDRGRRAPRRGTDLSSTVRGVSNGDRLRASSSRAQSRDDRPQPKIEDLLKEGQEVLVQVVKEPLGTKGARLTSHVTMPGRFLVFMPTVDHVGVSRKIEVARRARPPPWHRPRVPRGAWLHRRRHHPHRRGGPLQGRHRQRPRVFPPGVDRDPPADGIAASARRPVPGAEPRHQAAAGSADRRLHAPSASTTNRSIAGWSRSSSASCRTCCHA